MSLPIFSWFWGPVVTLQDCLAAFFARDELKGEQVDVTSTRPPEILKPVLILMSEFIFEMSCPVSPRGQHV